MNRGIAAILAGWTVIVLAPLPGPVFAAVDDAKICGVETARQEKQAAIPDHLLQAISLVETGRWDAVHRTRFAWPWTVASGEDGHFLPDKRSAIDLVRRLQAKGVGNIDVGCMQVNLQAHPRAFRDLDQAFDPAANVAYAAAFLVRLHDSTGNWPTAAAYYHSQTPLLAAAYESKVVEQWNATRNRGDDRLLVADVRATGPPLAATPEATGRLLVADVTATGPPPLPAPPEAAGEAARRAPLTAAAWFAIGRDALKAHDYAAAEPALIHAVALDSRNSLYLDTLGAISAAKGNTERALAAYQMAIAIDSDDGFAWYNTAVIQYNAGRTDGAIEAFRRAGIAYSSKGDTAGADRVLADLKSLSEGEKL
jgi:tetratricopeptide (TPR) repeat protein